MTRGVNQVASSFTRASAARIRSAAKRCASAIRTAAMSLGMRRALRLPMTCAHRSPAALTRSLRCQSTAVATSHIQRPWAATSLAAAAKCAPMQILFTAAKWGGMPPVPQGPLKSATNAAIRSPEVATHNTRHQTARTEPAARQCASSIHSAVQISGMTCASPPRVSRAPIQLMCADRMMVRCAVAGFPTTPVVAVMVSAAPPCASRSTPTAAKRAGTPCAHARQRSFAPQRL